MVERVDVDESLLPTRSTSILQLIEGLDDGIGGMATVPAKISRTWRMEGLSQGSGCEHKSPTSSSLSASCATMCPSSLGSTTCSSVDCSLFLHTQSASSISSSCSR
ncbi:hypothetical protein Mapa_007858 [Marchantia paleacea]|nr:hypothetical protein Mapa_007858 [Marchantia paleacea]